MDAMKKCYNKQKLHEVKLPQCGFCKKTIKTGHVLFTVTVRWGHSVFACSECFEDHEIIRNEE
jgi:hypothetical protein